MPLSATYDAETITPGQLKTAILDFIRDYEPVAFPEMLEKIPQAKGDKPFIYNESNIVFWLGLSQEGFDAIKALIDEGKVFPIETDELRYLMGGGALNLPIAKQVNKKYQEPHWLPILLTTKDPRKS